MKKMLEEMKKLNHEERLAFFEKNKSNLLEDALYSVNGGASNPNAGKNPNSDCPFENNWVSSYGYVCQGVVMCH